MTTERRSGLAKWWLLPWAILALIWFVAPALTTTEDATVFIGDCMEPECALKGDLTVGLFTRDYELTQSDGTVISFSPDSVNLMSWPAPK